MSTIEETVQLMNGLPENARTEVRDFARFLGERRRPAKQKRLRLSWAGGLREYRDRYTSLELQKKALEWRGD
jgi:hypothetical protein